MRPVWLCPLRLRDSTAGTNPWPTYPLEPGRTYVNVGFWGTVHVGPEAPEGPRNRAIEDEVTALGGHKSLYSEAFYDRPEFERLYGGDLPERMKATYDPDRRFPGLFEKTVNNA